MYNACINHLFVRETVFLVNMPLRAAKAAEIRRFGISSISAENHESGASASLPVHIHLS